MKSLALTVLMVTAVITCGQERPQPPTIPQSTNSPASRSAKHKKQKHHKVQLVWHASATKNISGYFVYRAEGAEPFVRLTAHPVKKTSYEDKKVSVGKTYAYAVSSVQKIDHRELESVRTGPITVTIPD